MTDPQADPVKQILERQGARIAIHGTKNSKFQQMAAELLLELQAERSKTSALNSNLNALLNQYQVVAASLKQLQASQERTAKMQQNLLDAAETPADDTSTQSK